MEEMYKGWALNFILFPTRNIIRRKVLMDWVHPFLTKYVMQDSFVRGNTPTGWNTWQGWGKGPLQFTEWLPTLDIITEISLFQRKHLPLNVHAMQEESCFCIFRISLETIPDFYKEAELRGYLCLAIGSVQQGCQKKRKTHGLNIYWEAAEWSPLIDFLTFYKTLFTALFQHTSTRHAIHPPPSQLLHEREGATNC